jgi:hypothetical protein
MRYLSFIRHPLPPAARLVNFFILFLTWGLSHSSAFAGEGREGVFYLKTGESLAGEIISVRTGSVIIQLGSDSNRIGEIVPSRLRLICAEDLNGVVLNEGSDYGLLGKCIGLAAGLTLGIAASNSMHSDTPEPWGGSMIDSKDLGGTFMGVTIMAICTYGGWAIGNAASDEVETMPSGEGLDWDALRKISRFQDSEPAYLQKLFPLPETQNGAS